MHQKISVAPVRLEIFFDLSCPFTLLAKLGIDGILRNTAVPVAVTWSPLILLPFIPAEGLDFHSSHAAKYGERSRPMQLDVERRALDLGVKIDHSRVTKVPNTLQAHRAVRFAAEAGRGADMIEAILRGYFCDGVDIGDRRALGVIVRALGLSETEFQIQMLSGWQRSEVRAAHLESVARGAKSVPSYRLNGEHIENTVDLLPRLRELVAG